MNKNLYLILLLAVSFGFSQSYNVPYRKRNLWGYADKIGQVIIEPKYDSVSTEFKTLDEYSFNL